MDMLRYLQIYRLLIRNSMIREMSFKANFLLWSLVEVLWFLGQILFIEVLFSHVDHIGDWTKWQVVALIGTHQVIAQLFQAFFYMNLTNLPELVRTGKLDVLLTLPIDAQFAVSTKQFGLDNLLNTFIGLALVAYSLHHLGIVPTPLQFLLYSITVAIGVSVHYSVMFGLSTLCFWIIRAQGLVYAYFNLFNVGRYPDTVFKGVFRAVFTWVIPVILVANVPTRMVVEPLQSTSAALFAFGQLLVVSSGLALVTRLFWKHALRRYSSASS